MITLDIIIDEDRDDGQPDDLLRFREHINRTFQVDSIQETDTSWTIEVDSLDAAIIQNVADDYRLYAETL